MNNIRRVSKCMRYIFSLFFLLYPLSLIAFWIIAPQSLSVGSAQNGIHLSYIPSGLPLIVPLDNETKLLGFAICLLPAVIYMYLLFNLINLFALYEKAKIFAAECATYIRRIGYMLLLGQLIHPLYQILISIAMTYKNPPSYHILHFNYTETNFGILLIGIIIILVSWVMSEGCRLQKEQEYTI